VSAGKSAHLTTMIVKKLSMTAPAMTEQAEAIAHELHP
jgi:hypothetical protein